MLGCVGIALALAILLFVPGLRESFEPPKAAALRACGLALLAATLAAPGARRRSPVTALDLAVAAWLAVELLATVFSRAPILSLVGETVQREGLLTSLSLAGVYLALRATPRAEGLAPLAGWILVPAVAASLYAFAQAAGLDPIRWLDPAIYMRGRVGMRPFGTLGHPNLLGVVSACAGSLAIARAAGAPPGRAWFAAAALVLAAATLATLSRGAWLALAAGALVGVPLALRARAEAGDARRVLIAAGLLLAALAAVALAAGWGERLVARTQELLSPLGGSGSSRIEIWRTAWAAFLARPWLGHGPDTLELVFPRFQTAAYWRTEWAGVVFHAHSIVLHTLATRGAAGLAAGVALLAGVALAARRAWRRSDEARAGVAPALAMVAAGLVAGLFGALGIAGALLVTVAGAGLANLAVPAGDEQSPPPRSPRAAIAGSLVALLAIAAGIADLRGAAAARSAEDWLAVARAGGGEDREIRQWALEAAARAARLAPLDDLNHRLGAEALLATAALASAPGAMLERADAEARRALALVPARAVNHEQLARVLAARALGGDPLAAEAAHDEVQRMAALAPANALLRVEGARLELVIGRPAQALTLAEAVLALYPSEGEAQAVLAEASLALGDSAAAQAALVRALAGDWHGDSAGRENARRLAAPRTRP